MVNSLLLTAGVLSPLVLHAVILINDAITVSVWMGTRSTAQELHSFASRRKGAGVPEALFTRVAAQFNRKACWISACALLDSLPLSRIVMLGLFEHSDTMFHFYTVQLTSVFVLGPSLCCRVTFWEAVASYSCPSTWTSLGSSTSGRCSG